MRTWKSLRVLLLAGCAACSFAQTLQFSNVNNSYIMGGVYTSPYNLLLNGVSTPLICDDFTTDVDTGGPWTATSTSLSSLMGETTASSAVKFDDTSASQQVLGYSTEAVLAAELMSLPNTATLQGAEISFAIWAVFDPGLLQFNGTQYTTNDPYGSLTTTEIQAALGILNQAEGWVNNAASSTVAGATTVNFSQVDAASGYAITGMTIYTASGTSLGNGQSQEFLQVSMPEPSYPAVLGLDLLAAAGLIVAFRRRTARKT